MPNKNFNENIIEQQPKENLQNTVEPLLTDKAWAAQRVWLLAQDPDFEKWLKTSLPMTWKDIGKVSRDALNVEQILIALLYAAGRQFLGDKNVALEVIHEKIEPLLFEAKKRYEMQGVREVVKTLIMIQRTVVV